MHTASKAARSRTVQVALLTAMGCAVAGVGIAQGTRRGYVAVAVLAGLALLVVIGQLGFETLRIWAIVGVVAYPFLRLPAGHPIVTFDRIWVLGMVALLIATPLVRRRRADAANLLEWSLLWLAGAYAIRAVLTPTDQLGNIETAVDATILPLILFAVTRREANTVARCRQLAGILVIAGVTLAAIGIAERALGFQLASLSGGAARFDTNVRLVRISGPYPAPETYALSLLCCIAATVYWLQLRRAYVLGSAALALQLTAVGLALFRTAWVGALLILVLGFGLRPKRYGRLLTVVAAVAIVAFIGYDQLQNNSSFSARAGNTSNFYTRIAAYEQSWELFRGHAIFGVGVNQFPAASASVPMIVVHGQEAPNFPHDSFLQQLAEQGLWGLLPTLAVAFAVWWLLRAFGRTLSREDDAILYGSAMGAAIAYLLMSLTLAMLAYGPSNSFFAIILGMVAARLDDTTTDALTP